MSFPIVSALYGMSIFASICLLPINPVKISWTNTIDNHTMSTITDENSKWNSVIIISGILTFANLIFSIISIKQIKDSYIINMSPNELSRHFISIGLIWLLSALLSFFLVYSYEPQNIPPYTKAHFQPIDSNCSYYYTNATYDQCFDIFSDRNVTNNRICCLNIASNGYIILVGSIGMIILTLTLIFPAWLLYGYYGTKSNEYAILN